MKKEHWLYLVIAILAIWIIASYMTAPKTGYAPETDEVSENDSDIELSDLPDDSATPGGEEPSDTTDTTGSLDTTVTMNPVTVVSTEIPSSAKISVSNQNAGSMVKVGNVDMTVDGWVVVREDREGAAGNILGAQRFDAGSYSGGQVELLRDTVAGGKYYVMIYKDNGDKMFDHTLDTPLMVGSQMVVDTFVAE